MTDRSCERLTVGVFNEPESEHTTAANLEPWGLTASGRSVRASRLKPGMKCRVPWVDR